jgi:hypothetical protein
LVDNLHLVYGAPSTSASSSARRSWRVPHRRSGLAGHGQLDRITLHFTPTRCSWIDLVECFFCVLTRRAIRRGSFTSVRQLTETIGALIGSWDDHARRFAWTKDADEVLASINSAKTKVTLLRTTTRHSFAKDFQGLIFYRRTREKPGIHLTV